MWCAAADDVVRRTLAKAVRHGRDGASPWRRTRCRHTPAGEAPRSRRRLRRRSRTTGMAIRSETARSRTIVPPHGIDGTASPVRPARARRVRTCRAVAGTWSSPPPRARRRPPARPRAPLFTARVEPDPRTVPGDRLSPVLDETSVLLDVVERPARTVRRAEYYLSGPPTGPRPPAAGGDRRAVPHADRRTEAAARPAFNGTVLMERQNVTAGYDLDAWSPDHVSARARVGRRLDAADRGQRAARWSPRAGW